MANRTTLCAVAVALLAAGCSQTLSTGQSTDSPTTITTTVSTTTTSTSEPTSTTLSQLDQAREAQRAELETIKASMIAYQHELDNRSGDNAVSLLTEASLNSYSEILELAQTGDLEALKAAPVYQFYRAVQLRAVLGSDVHLLTTGSEAFIALADRGRVLRMGQDPADYRVVRDSGATASIYFGPQPSYWILHLEDGEWLVDINYIGNFYTVINDEAGSLESLTGYTDDRDQVLYFEGLIPGFDLSVPPPK